MEELMDEERIRNAVEVEKRRLTVEVGKRRLAVEELVKKMKLTKEELEQVRDTRRKFVLHISPLEIVEKGDEDFIDDDDVVAENVNQIELVIHVIYHYYIYQYWSPPPPPTATMAVNSSSSLAACQHHHDYHHPRDADDEDMILTSCRPLGDDPPQKFKIILAISDDDDDHTALLGELDVLLEHHVVIRTSELEDLKRGIAQSISEAAVLRRREKQPKRARICCEVSRVTKQYFGSAEAATFVAVEDDAEDASASSVYFNYIFD